MAETNWVAEAIERCGGGGRTVKRLYAEHGVEVSEATVYRWRDQGWINDAKALFALAAMAKLEPRLLIVHGTEQDGTPDPTSTRVTRRGGKGGGSSTGNAAEEPAGPVLRLVA